jgi:hypothetical protein
MDVIGYSGMSRAVLAPFRSAPDRPAPNWGRSLEHSGKGGQLKAILNWRSQLGRHPLHRIGLGDDLVDVIAIDALKRAHLESGPRRLDARQDHWTQTYGAGVGLNCYAAWIKQDC